MILTPTKLIKKPKLRKPSPTPIRNAVADAAFWLAGHRPSAALLLLLAQLLATAAIVYGIYLYSHPVAFIIGGLLGVAAIETQARGQKPKLTTHNQQQIKLALAAGKDPFAEPYDVPLTAELVAYASSLRKQR